MSFRCFLAPILSLSLFAKGVAINGTITRLPRIVAAAISTTNLNTPRASSFTFSYSLGILLSNSFKLS